MKKLILLPLVTFVVLTLLAPTFAGANPKQDKIIADYFAELAHEDVNFEPEGAVCERVALREVDALYPHANFDVVNSIQYDDKKTTLGELDLVIFDKATGMVEAIAEVKCWKSFQGALKKAKAQRMRFQTFLGRNIVLRDTDNKIYPKRVFENVKRYFSISQSGGVNQGFDFELSLDLKELMELRKELLDCQAQGRCPQK